MNRRTFLYAVTGAALGVSHDATSQATAAPRVGVLYTTTPSVIFDELAPALRDLGYANGANILLEPRTSAGRPDSLPALAADLVRTNVAALVAVGPAAVAASVAATKSIPIIAVDLESDPVARGWAGSLARPAANLTGFFMDHPAMATKWLELLKEVVPGIRRVALLWDSTTGRSQVDAATSAARRLAIEVHVTEIRNVDELNAKLRPDVGPGRIAMVILSSPIFFASSAQIAAYALQHRIAAISPFKPFAEFGGLMSYGPDLHDFARRTASYVGRILKGEKASDLPIQQPTKFEMVVNLRTARAIGLAIPRSLQLRADEAIR